MSNKLLDLLVTFLDPTEDEILQIQKAISRFPVKGKQLANEIERELNIPPTIALIGKSGVGKSTTINELFNPDPLLPVGAVWPTTMHPCKINVPLGGRRGSINIIDGPGLGASKRSSNELLPMYSQLIPGCDLILWIIKSDDKALEADQIYIEKLLTDDLRSRLVIGVNQVDKIEPGKWNDEYNLPNPEQNISISEKEDYVKEVLLEIGIQPWQIVSYSALRHYRLTTLFSAMLNACPKTRGWVLHNKMDITKYSSPAARKRYGRSKKVRG